MRVFIALLGLILLFLTWDTVALGGRYQNGLLASAAAYGAAARHETRYRLRRAGF